MILISAAQTLFAIGSIVLAGFGALRLIAPQQADEPVIERIGLCWLLGGGWVSLMIATLGTILDGEALIVGVLLSIGLLIFFGRRTKPSNWMTAIRLNLWEMLLVAVIAAEVFVIGIYASKICLEWDALMTWEWKSRLAFLNGGSLPAKYFSDPTYDWSLPRYPLQLPYLGSWLYLCLGRFDQAWIRVIGPIYYLAAASVVAGACQRLQGSRLVGLFGAAAMFFVPYFFSGTWGMFAGYADLPLGALLLAAISRIPALDGDSSSQQARLCGVFAALLPWMKREGVHLWAVVTILALIQIWQLKAWRRLPWLVIPGIVMMAAFQAILALVHALPLRDAVTISIGHLGERVDRVGLVATHLFSAATDFEAWSLLWPGAAAAVIVLVMQRRFRLAVTFGGALFLCWLLLGTVYIVGFPNDLETMIGVTIDRIVLQFAPLAVLTVAVAVPRLPSKSEK